MKNSVSFYCNNEPTILLANYIHYDGIGDFHHLLGIIKEFQPYTEQLKIQMVPFIICDASREKEVTKKIDELNLNLKPVIFTHHRSASPIMPLMEQFETFVQSNLSFQKKLGSCLAVFQISTGLEKEQKDILRKYTPFNIPVVTIAEHSGLRTTANFLPMGRVDPDDQLSKTIPKNINDRWMGLDHYGIKLTPTMNKSKTITLLNLDNKKFLNALLKKESLDNSEQITDEFFKKNNFIPGYLQSEEGIVKFFNFCIQHSDFNNQNILFVLNNFNKLFTKKNCQIDNEELITSNVIIKDLADITTVKADYMVVSYFVDKVITNVKLLNTLRHKGFSGIEININGKTCEIIFPENQCQKQIRIFTDFIFNEQDYDNLYTLGHSIAAFSGDNTFEKVLSHQLIPFLSPGKYEFEKSIKLLLEFAIEHYGSTMSDEVKHEFIQYFDGSKMRLDTPEKMDSLLSVNLQSILKHWPSIVEQLKEEKNMYHHLKNILCEALLHTAANHNDVHLLDQLFKLSPNMNRHIPNKKGHTAQMIAEKKEHKEFLTKLAEDEQRLLSEDEENPSKNRLV